MIFSEKSNPNRLRFFWRRFGHRFILPPMPKPKAEWDFFRSRAFREGAVVLFVAGLFGALILAMVSNTNSKLKVDPIRCSNNLRQTVLGLKMFANDHNDQFPVQVSTNTGGTKEWAYTTNVYRHFLAASNELATPLILACPQDPRRLRSVDWTNFSNRNLSYWIELNAYEKGPIIALVGDWYLETNGTPLPNGSFQIATQQFLGWSKHLHNGGNYVDLVDGSTKLCNTQELNNIRSGQMFPTNWLAIP
jgi:hypothetical protein